MKTNYLTPGRLFTVLLCLSFLIVQLDAQTISYDYDSSGNRISRKVITLSPPPQGVKSSPVDSVVVAAIIGERQVLIYPNPTKGALGVDITGGDTEESIRLILYNGQGVMLYTTNATQGINIIEMSPFPKGWYILRVATEMKIEEFKIIKQ